MQKNIRTMLQKPAVWPAAAHAGRHFHQGAKNHGAAQPGSRHGHGRQHFKLVPGFTVAQNVLLGHEPRRSLFYDQQAAIETVRRLSQEYGLKVEPTDTVQDLSVGLQQRVEILKALRTGADVLILDEPTAVLTPQETEELFQVIRRSARAELYPGGPHEHGRQGQCGGKPAGGQPA